MVVVDASVLVDALLIDGPARARLADANLQAPDLIDAELLSVLRRLVWASPVFVDSCSGSLLINNTAF